MFYSLCWLSSLLVQQFCHGKHILRPSSYAYSATVLASVLHQATSDAVLQGLAQNIP